MPKENQSDGRAHDCDHEQIFCAHGHIHAHRKSRVIGVLMAMCTSKPIIGKRAGGGERINFFINNNQLDIVNVIEYWKSMKRPFFAAVVLGQFENIITASPDLLLMQTS